MGARIFVELAVLVLKAGVGMIIPKDRNSFKTSGLTRHYGVTIRAGSR